MTQQPSLIISITSLVISAIALYLNFKKDAHRLHVWHQPTNKSYDIVSICNNSAFPVRVSGVFYINGSGEVIWPDVVGNHDTNRFMSYPFEVGARSTYRVMVPYRNVPRGGVYGYCIRLDCNRLYVSSGSLPSPAARDFKVKSILSRLFPKKFNFITSLAPSDW
jgi:hypothetical protein